jgi:selenocysteine-specific elongation factor
LTSWMLNSSGMQTVVIGTAGHIDHGKTTLVKALTGIDTDRLKEEKSRGITIELGFAHLDLKAGLRASIVDVPGHERFVKSMVAGTTGIDMVLLVVAADEGIMPQTREHLDICNLLEVEHGLVALTKVDLVEDPEWLEMVTEDLRTELEGTFLQNCPIVRVSGRTGAGIQQLKNALVEVAGGVETRSADAPAFLGIDRAFIMHGFGTVVTGTLVSGSLKVDDSVDVLPDPSGKLAGLKIRGLQVHNRDETRVSPGQRVAINLSGTERSMLARGLALVHAQTLREGRDFECTLQLVPGAKPIRSRTSAVFHTGTAKSNARLRLIGTDTLKPSETAYVSVHCEQPLAAFPGHRYILRGFSTIPGRGTTQGGGRILSILAPRRRLKDRGQWLSDLEVLKSGTAGERLLVLLRRAGARGLDQKSLRMRSGLGTASLDRELDKLMAAGQVKKFDRERGSFVEAGVLKDLRAQAQGLLEAYHQANPLLPGMPSEELRNRLADGLNPRLFRLLLDELAKDQTALQEGEVVRLSRHRVQLDESGAELEKSALAIYKNSGLAPPRLEEVARKADRPRPEVAELARHLARTGLLVHITGDMYVLREALDDLRRRLVAYLKQNDEITTQDFKNMVGASRKHVIPLAEFFDREKTTLRVGEKRVLRKKGSGPEDE